MCLETHSLAEIIEELLDALISCDGALQVMLSVFVCKLKPICLESADYCVQIKAQVLATCHIVVGLDSLPDPCPAKCGFSSCNDQHDCSTG